MTTRMMAAGTTALLALALWTPPALAEPPSGGPPMGGPMGGPGMGFAGPESDPGMMFGLMLRSVGLSAEQHTKTRSIMETHRPRFQTLFARLRTTNEAMTSRMFTAGPLSMDDLQPQIDQVTRLREQLVQEGTRVALDLRAVLTPEQLAKAADVSQRLQALRAEMKSLLGDPMMPPP